METFEKINIKSQELYSGAKIEIAGMLSEVETLHPAGSTVTLQLVRLGSGSRSRMTLILFRDVQVTVLV